MACTLSRFTARRTTRHRTSAWPGSWCHVKSTRLTESPACLVTEASGITPALARMYRASGQAVPVGKRILELNPKHPLVTGNRCSGTAATIPHWSNRRIAQGTALLAEGDVPEDPAKFAGLLAERLARTV
jgi:molecular chaperone HtpG